MKIKVSSFVFGWLCQADSWFYKYVEPINRKYCEIYGYEYVVDNYNEHPEWVSDRDNDRSSIWYKVGHIKRNLKDCDYLLYLDADAIFYPSALDIETEILPYLPQHKSIYIGHDVMGVGGYYYVVGTLVNSGVILFRNDAVSHEFLTEWDNITDIPEYNKLKHEWPLDQTGFDILRQDARFVEAIHLEPFTMRLQGHCGRFIRHLAGPGWDYKAEVFKEINEIWSKRTVK